MMGCYELSRAGSRRVRLAVCTVFLSAVTVAAHGNKNLVNKDADNVAIQGYDTVAYFTEGRALKGRGNIDFEWHGARWLFINEKNRSMFAATPERYAPQFGGLCAGAMARGVAIKANPEAWTIVDGKLYMKLNKQVRERWREDTAGNISKATEVWEQMQEKK